MANFMLCLFTTTKNKTKLMKLSPVLFVNTISDSTQKKKKKERRRCMYRGILAGDSRYANRERLVKEQMHH